MEAEKEYLEFIQAFSKYLEAIKLKKGYYNFQIDILHGKKGEYNYFHDCLIQSSEKQIFDYERRKKFSKSSRLNK